MVIPSLLYSSETWTITGTNEKKNPNNRGENATEDSRIHKERQNDEYRNKETQVSGQIRNKWILPFKENQN